jgi:hypothetical protein
MNTLLKALLIGLLLVPSTSLWAQADPDPWPGDVIDRIRFGLGDEFSDLGVDLQASIFESLTDLDWDSDFGNFNFGIGVKRRVFDNQDIFNTWTVIDFFQVPMGLPINILDPVSFGTYGVAQLNLDVRLSLDSYHIRQVYPEDFDQLPSLDNLRADLSQVDDHSDDTPSGDGVVVYDPFADNMPPSQNLFTLLSFNTQNPRTRARYGRFLNLFTSVLGLPINSKQALKMPKGDIRSYSLNGAIQFGPSVGWGGVDVPGLNVALTAGFSTFIRGKWKISTFKESPHTIKLKVTREKGRGHDAYLGSRTKDHEIFDGVLLLGDRIADIKESVIPFYFSARKEVTKSFDVGYKYDLRGPMAKKAYNLAALGRLTLSDKLSQEVNSGVEKVFTRQQTRDSYTKNYKLKLSLFYQKARTRSRSVTSALINIDDKEFHVFKGESRTTKSSDTLLGSSEYQSVKFVTTIDEDIYNASDEGLNFSIEGRYRDAFTSAKEYMQTIAIVENATGFIDRFPRVPLGLPQGELNQCSHPTPDQFRNVRRRRNSCNMSHYGQLEDTSFYYRMAFDTKQMQKFFNYPENQMWELLEQAFGIEEGSWNTPVSRFWYGLRNSYATVLNIPLMFADQHLDNGHKIFMAKIFFERWKDLNLSLNDPKELALKMSKLFSTAHYSHELINVFKLAMEDSPYGLILQARASEVFGQISEQINEFNALDRMVQRANDIIDFDSIGPQTSIDTEAQVDDLEIEYISSDKVKIRFFLEKSPEFLFFVLERSSGWFRYQNLIHTIVYNNGTFQRGANTMIVNRGDTDGITGRLAKHIFEDQQMIFKMAISQDGERWGAVASERLSPSRR